MVDHEGRLVGIDVDGAAVAWLPPSVLGKLSGFSVAWGSVSD